MQEIRDKDVYTHKQLEEKEQQSTSLAAQLTEWEQKHKAMEDKKKENEQK